MTNIRFRHYLKHQAVYAVLAIAMNSYSYYLHYHGQPKLTITDPIAGISIFLLYSPVLLLGLAGWYRTYVVLTIIFLGPILFSGVLGHVTAILSPDGMSAYASSLWWAAAILLNIYGMTISILALLSLRHNSVSNK